jgi:hypothetical protein
VEEKNMYAWRRSYVVEQLVFSAMERIMTTICFTAYGSMSTRLMSTNYQGVEEDTTLIIIGKIVEIVIKSSVKLLDLRMYRFVIATFGMPSYKYDHKKRSIVSKISNEYFGMPSYKYDHKRPIRGHRGATTI